MKKTLLILLGMIVTCNFTLAQKKYNFENKDLVIIRSNNPQPGFYMSYADFVFNTPNDKGFDFNKNINIFGKERFFSHLKQKMFVSYGDDKKKTKIRFKFWGYNDGKAIYVLVNDRYSRIDYLGKYSIVIWNIDKLLFESNRIHRDRQEKSFVLDISTGQFYKLTPKTMKKHILKNEPELLSAYKKEPTNYMKYIKEVNSKFSSK